jgi:phage terminase small subunit
MQQRGRSSESEREVARLVTITSDRPDPPPELSAEQADEWRAVVGRLPPNWFKREHYGVLVSYCCHVTQRRFLEKELRIQSIEGEGLERFNDLAKAVDRETRAILLCARAMRMTHQSQYDKDKASRSSNKAPAEGTRPWEDTAVG